MVVVVVVVPNVWSVFSEVTLCEGLRLLIRKSLSSCCVGLVVVVEVVSRSHACIANWRANWFAVWAANCCIPVALIDRWQEWCGTGLDLEFE